MEVLAAVSAFATVFVLMLAFARNDGRVRSRLQAVRGLPAGAGPGDEEDEAQPFTERMIAPLVQTPVRMVKGALPTRMLGGFQARLILAGEPMTINGFLTFQLVITGAFILLPLLMAGALGILGNPIMLLMLLGFAAVGLLLPNMWLNSRVNARQNEIIKSLPDAFDLITTCVEAGLGLDAALSRVAEKVEGPFADELSRCLREVSLGQARRDALKELGERTGVPDLIAFISAVNQAEAMGSSVGAVLRVQSAQLRVRRRQRAEEQAYKAPVKMIFPLVLCIFPTLFIVILGPAVITIIQDFPSG